MVTANNNEADFKETPFCEDEQHIGFMRILPRESNVRTVRAIQAKRCHYFSLHVSGLSSYSMTVALQFSKHIVAFEMWFGDVREMQTIELK